MFRSDAIFRDYSQTIILSIVKRNCNIHCVVRVLYNYCKIHLKCYRNCKQHNVFLYYSIKMYRSICIYDIYDCITSCYF